MDIVVSRENRQFSAEGTPLVLLVLFEH